MRVIAGAAKGRHLKGPPARRTARRAPGVRPSSDLVRGALFSALEAMGANIGRVLDLYAGTGALGVEALSRGAGWCDFVERDRMMAAVIEENLRLTGFGDRARIHTIDAARAVGLLAGPYTLVLADPPYADASAWAVVQSLADSGLVIPDETTLVLEHGARDEPHRQAGPLHRARLLRHGDSAVSIYRPVSRRAPNGGERC